MLDDTKFIPIFFHGRCYFTQFDMCFMRSKSKPLKTQMDICIIIIFKYSPPQQLKVILWQCYGKNPISQAMCQLLIQLHDRPGLILGLSPANGRRRYKVTHLSLAGHKPRISPDRLIGYTGTHFIDKHCTPLIHLEPDGLQPSLLIK